jgi:tRNA(Ile)-lysidine synthase
MKPSSQPHFDLLLPEAPFKGRVRLLVALSGGSDSTALLSLLREKWASPQTRLLAAHVNYGLRGKASQKDEAFVRALCARWNIPLRVLTLKKAVQSARREKKSFQDWARERRYAFFDRVCRSRKAWGVAVAHQTEDQAETILDRLLRGAGPQGLTGLRPFQELLLSKSKKGLKIWRPLLAFTREDLKKYLESQNLSWREDRSNQKTDYRRNQIRHELLPFLSRWNPRIVRTLFKIGEVAAAQEAFMMESLEGIKKSLKGRWSASSYRGPKTSFERLPLALQRLFIREAAKRLNPSARGLSFDRLEEATLVWKGRQKGPRDLGFGLSVGVLKHEVWMRADRKQKEG